MPPSTSCKYCNAEIQWSTVKPSGKRMPLDPSWDAEYGNLRRTFHKDATGRHFSTVEVLTGAELAEARDLAARYPADPTYRLWVPHKATCPAFKNRRSQR